MIRKKDLLKYIILLIIIFSSLGIILITENPTYHVSAIWLLVLAAIILTKFEIAHPLVWFSSSFALYSTAYALLHVLEYPTHSGYSKESMLLPFIALSTFIIIVGVKKIKRPNFHEIKESTFLSNEQSKKIFELILYSLLIVLGLCVSMLFITPFEHKNDMISNRNIFFIVGVYCTRFLSFFTSFYLLLFFDSEYKKTKYFIVLSISLIVLFSLFTGDRDAMFRFFIILIITLFLLNKISKKMIVLLIPVGMFYLTMSRFFKYYFVTGETKNSYEDESFIYSFLISDFSAAGGNLQILLNNPWTESIHGFSLIIFDFISPFIPSGFFLNVGSWFNNTFFPNSYSRAFTLVGQGYVIGGIVGIIAIFLILAFGIRFLYRKSSTNIYWLVIYIYSIPTLITGFRSTLGTITTGLIRIAVFGILIHLILFLFINVNQKHKRRKVVRI